MALAAAVPARRTQNPSLGTSDGKLLLRCDIHEHARPAGHGRHAQWLACLSVLLTDVRAGRGKEQPTLGEWMDGWMDDVPTTQTNTKPRALVYKHATCSLCACDTE